MDRASLWSVWLALCDSRASTRRRGKQFYRPYMQAGWPVMTIVARSIATPNAYAIPVKQALASVLPDIPVSNIDTMENIVHDSTGGRRFPMLLLSVFSILALVLAAVGIVGVVAIPLRSVHMRSASAWRSARMP
ncbi:MAG: hypothetical protein WDO73_09530 [Ignavibacteriota bacterium]